MCISFLGNDYIRNTFCMGGKRDEENIIIGLLDSVCKARIDDYQLQSRRAGPSAASDIHYNAGREINFAK